MVDFVNTPACSVCRNLVNGTDGVYAACWRDLKFFTPPSAIAPAFPLTEAPGPEGTGLTAIINPPSYNRARALLKYTGIGAQLIRRIKYSDQSELAAMLAPLILRAATPLFSTADL